MSDHPDTIYNPNSFDKSQWHIECPYCGMIIGFDGIFDWSWTQGCFGEKKITPMDFDGVVERKRHYLIFETKNVGIEIPYGQILCLENLNKAKSFTVVKIWGKRMPEYSEINYSNGRIEKFGAGYE